MSVELRQPARLAEIAHRRVADDPVALQELAACVRVGQWGAALSRAAEQGMLRVIDRYAARRRRERGAA